MTVYVGSARSDENGKAYNGKAGDQTGREVSTQAWYKHSKGWRVIRAKDSAKRGDIADQMRKACGNLNIGYDQWQRDTLLNAVKDKGYNVALADKPVETDCSALVRVCVAHAYGYDVAAAVMGDDRWSTANMCRYLLKSGLFVEMIGDQYTASPDYLRAGDILCTRTQGHTVVVLNDGTKAGTEPAAPVPGDRILRKGMTGSDVRTVQEWLMLLGYDLGSCGADGDFGAKTDAAVRAFQRAHGLTVDGEYGPKTHECMQAMPAISGDEDDAPTVRTLIEVTGGNVFVRSGPGADYPALTVVHAGDRLVALSCDASWWCVDLGGDKTGWIGPKYTRAVEE